MVSSDIESLVGSSLRGICAEMFARLGYHVVEGPSEYDGVDILVVSSPTETEEKIYFVTVAGRASVDYLGEGDMEEALPEKLELPDGGVLLVVTTARNSSRGARRVAKQDARRKDVWYAGDILSRLEKLNSEYLIDIYTNDMNGFDTEEELRNRFDYQNIEVSDEVIEYIYDDTYHPRRLIAFVELRSRGIKTDLSDTEAVKEFIRKTDVLVSIR